jgi:hypothetical protein
MKQSGRQISKLTVTIFEKLTWNSASSRFQN